MDFDEFNISYYRKVNSQIIRMLTNILPEDGPILNIVDHDGSVWSTDEPRFRRFVDEDTITGRIIQKLDDGHDPILIDIETGVIAASQMDILSLNSSYLLYFLPGYCHESAIANMDLIETVFSMSNIIVENALRKQTNSDNFSRHQVHWMPELSFK